MKKVDNKYVKFSNVFRIDTKSNSVIFNENGLTASHRKRFLKGENPYNFCMQYLNYWLRIKIDVLKLRGYHILFHHKNSDKKVLVIMNK